MIVGEADIAGVESGHDVGADLEARRQIPADAGRRTEIAHEGESTGRHADRLLDVLPFEHVCARVQHHAAAEQRVLRPELIAPQRIRRIGRGRRPEAERIEVGCAQFGGNGLVDAALPITFGRGGIQEVVGVQLVREAYLRCYRCIPLHARDR